MFEVDEMEFKFWGNIFEFIENYQRTSQRIKLFHWFSQQNVNMCEFEYLKVHSVSYNCKENLPLSSELEQVFGSLPKCKSLSF